MNDRYVLICILVSAAATLFMRALPFTILGKRKQIPEKIRYLGRILPAAIMAVLTVYCLKEVPTEFLSGGYKKLIAAVARVVNKITTPRSRGMRTRVVFKGHTLL
mgnify:FL=1